MRKATILVLVLLAVGGLLLFSVGVMAADAKPSIEKGKEIFNSKCTACHTIGGGRKVGPDLKGVTEKRSHEWLVSFVSGPEHMFQENDPTAEQLLKEYGIKMPDLNLSKEQVDDVLAYIKSESGSQSGGDPSPQVSDFSGSIEKGKEIFNSKCNACHTIGGGRKIGPDLEGVTEKRPHDWLVNFTADPEHMFEQNDPTAEKLLKEYGVKMPNQGLTKEQAIDVLTYIQSESGS
jgi:cytochrome c2